MPVRIDHLPVHHTNELAQSEGVTGKQFVRHWMHTNHITVEGEKISKSLGNSITLEDIEAKGISLEAFRLHVLESHYRSQSKFSWESLHAAQSRLTRWRQLSYLRWQAIELSQADDVRTDAVREFTEALQDDLDTPRALAAIEALFSIIERDGVTSSSLASFIKLLQTIDQAFGIRLLGEDVSADQNSLIVSRENARKEKRQTGRQTNSQRRSIYQPSALRALWHAKGRCLGTGEYWACWRTGEFKIWAANYPALSILALKEIRDFLKATRTAERACSNRVWKLIRPKCQQHTKVRLRKQ